MASNVEGHSDIAIFTPCCSPWVSNNGVVLAVFNTIPNSCNSMIKRVSTDAWVEDSALVGVEDWVAGIDRHTCWLSIKGASQLICTVWWQMEVVSHGNLSLSGWGNTIVILGSIWVVLLEGNWVSHGVFKGKPFKTTVTTSTICVAVDELLLWELLQLAGCDLMGSFDGSSWREGPAWTTLTLVLNWVNSSS